MHAPSPRRRPPLALTALAVVASALAGPAGAITIDNGLAPPNPANVIDTGESIVEVLDSAEGDPTTVEIAPGGSVLTAIVAGHSRIEITGGVVVDLALADEAQGEMTSGGVVAPELFGSSTFTLRGGSVSGDFDVNDTSRLTWRGGTLESALNVLDGALAVVVGSGFEVDGIPVPLGPVTAGSGNLTGTLVAGGTLDVPFLRAPGATLLLVPEPATTALLILGLLAAQPGRSPRSQSPAR